jgi:hypothetical protein
MAFGASACRAAADAPISIPVLDNGGSPWLHAVIAADSNSENSVAHIFRVIAILLPFALKSTGSRSSAGT